MKKRVLSAIISIFILFLFLFYLPKHFFYLFFFAITTLSLYELHKMMFTKINIYFYLSVISSFILFGALIKGFDNTFFYLLTTIFLISSIFVIFNFDKFETMINDFCKFIFSILYISMLSSFGLMIFNSARGDIFLLHFLIICWATDSFAYIVGSNFGKRKLCEKISPKKSVEGFYGGVAGGVLAGSVGYFFLHDKFIIIIFTSLFTSLACVVGDLFESVLKRKFNIKDTGNIIPGHGGVLDRIDGVLIALPIYYLWSKLVL